MSLPPQALTKGEAFAVAALTMPYMVLQSAGRLIGRTLSRTPAAAAPAPAAPAPAAVKPQAPTVSPSTAFTVANRVCSADIGGLKVNFFQYFDAKVIKVSCRANRRLQEATFTPVIADECGIAYDLDGAIQWIRERGFGGARAQSSKSTTHERNALAQSDNADLSAPFDEPYRSPPMARPGLAKPRSQKPASSGANEEFTHTLVPADERHGRPFRGRILNFGEETRPARGDQKAYVTYVLRMESESREYTKDFIGEHLQELVEKNDLSIGDLITVQLVGKEHFQVNVNGKMEPRKRNHYSIKVH